MQRRMVSASSLDNLRMEIDRESKLGWSLVTGSIQSLRGPIDPPRSYAPYWYVAIVEKLPQPRPVEVHRGNPITDHVWEVTDTLMRQYIEMMAGAYLKETTIDPREVELVQDFQDGGQRVVFYFRKRGSKDGDTI